MTLMMLMKELFHPGRNRLPPKHSLKLHYGKYIGNIGFFVILQSMILRTPKWLKFITYLPITYLDLFFFENFQLKIFLEP